MKMQAKEYDISQFDEGTVIFSDNSAFYFPRWNASWIALRLAFERSDRSMDTSLSNIAFILGKNLLSQASMFLMMSIVLIASLYSLQLGGTVLVIGVAIALGVLWEDLMLDMRLRRCQKKNDVDTAIILVNKARSSA